MMTTKSWPCAGSFSFGQRALSERCTLIFMRWIALLTLAFSSSCVIQRGELSGGEPRDAFTDLDAPVPDAPGLDAPIPDAPGLDAPRPDAFGLDAQDDAVVANLDAFAEPDVFTSPDAFTPPDVFTPPDAFVTPDAFTPPDVGNDAFVCAGYVVYAQCVSGLRLWLDAGDLRLLEGAGVDRWVNRATASPTGDAVRPGGEAAVTYTVTTGPAVMMGAGRLRTEGDISVNRSRHFEVFIAATSRSTTNGYVFETGGGTTPRLSAHLPWTDSTEPMAYFDIPFVEASTRIGASFVSRGVWHAYRGATGSALFVNNMPLPASGNSVERDSRQQLWIGGNNANTARNELNLHELIIFNEPISDSARAGIRAGMQSRWFPAL